MHNLLFRLYFDCIYFHNYNECVNILLIEWGWMVAGAAPGLQIRVSGRRTFRGVFDSHASPPKSRFEVRGSRFEYGEAYISGLISK